jgi:hypothetical protein
MKDRTFNDFSTRALSRSLNNSSALQSNGKTRFRENIGTLRNRASFTDEVTEDEPNTYTFRLNRRTTLNVELENREDSDFFDIFGTRRRVQATLRDSDGDTLRSTDRLRPDDDDDFRVRLSAGTYSIRVTGRSEDEVEYRLRLQTSNNGFDDDDDDDDDFDFDDDD